jgi:cytoskeleton protein RodZ
MVLPGSATSPREFGAALRTARERGDVHLDVIAERTKIGRRLLEALEAGEFAKLPNRVFVRLFLQQYLVLIGERPESWMPAFEATWQRFEDSSQPWEVAAPAPSRGGRWLPWLIGFGVVGAGFAALMLVERGRVGTDSHAAAPTPAALVPAAAAPAVEQPTPFPEPTAVANPPDVLILRTGDRPCWVEVRVQGSRPESRLLAAGEEWRIEAGGRAVDLLAGDAGALRLEYLGEQRAGLGTDGQVARVQLGPAATPTAPGPTP